MNDREELKWLNDAIGRHERLAGMVANLLESLIRARKIDFLSVSHRVKNIASAREKILRKDYDNPESQMTDITGVRVVTYLEAQASLVCKLIRASFEVDEKNSLDKAAVLGEDRVGYRSVHFVCSLGKKRQLLPEYADLCNLKFEIQVRTVLQHAWAELSHDNSFKFETALPEALQRKLNLHSAMLEIVDSAFQEIYNDVEKYRKSISKKTIDQISASKVDRISVERALKVILGENDIKIVYSMDTRLLEELREFGIRSIGDLQAAIDDKYIAAYKKTKDRSRKNSMNGFLRNVMMFSNIEKYLSIPTDWTGLRESTYDLLREKYPGEQIDMLLEQADKHLIHEAVGRPRKRAS